MFIFDAHIKYLSLIRKILSSLDIHISELLRGSGISLIFRILGLLSAYGYVLLITRYYGAEGQGLFAFVITVALMLSYLANRGLNIYSVKIIPQHAEDSDIRAFYLIRSLRVVFVSSIALGLLFGLVLPRILKELGYAEFMREFQLAAILQLPLSILLLLSSIYRGEKRITLFSVLQVNVLYAPAMFILWFMHRLSQDAENAIYALLILTTVIAVMAFLANWGNITSAKKSNLNLNFSNILIEARPMIFIGVMFFLMSWSDRFMLRFLATSYDLGIFDVCSRLANVCGIGLMAVATMAEPKFAELHGEGDDLKKFVQRTTRLSLVSGAALVVLVIGLGEFLLGLFGEQGDFLVGRNTLILLCLGQLVNALCGPVLGLLNMTGYQNVVKMIIVSATVINICLNALLIPALGINGAALSTLVGTIVWNITAFLFVYRHHKFWMI